MGGMGRAVAVPLTALLMALALSQGAIACKSAPVQSTADYIFRHATHVFAGIAEKVELIEFPATEGFLPESTIRVTWRVDKTLKGENFDGKATLARYPCGGVDVIVGIPYVVAVEPVSPLLPGYTLALGVAGQLNDEGTKNVRDLTYDALMGGFERLSTKK